MKPSSDQFKLGLSLVINAVSKLPAILVVTSVLPQIKQSLGLDNYNSLLAALAIGGFFTMPFGGVNVVARRLVGIYFGKGDQAAQANAFVSSVVVGAALTVAACLITLLLSGTVFANSMSLAAGIAACVPILAAGLNLSDNVRAAFNEHYVTATLLAVFQLAIYVPVILLRPSIGGLLTATLILQAPMLLTSSVQVFLLLIKRRYLLCGGLGQISEVLRGSFVFSLGEGALLGAISASIFFLSTYGGAGEGAWYGTFVRLFQTILAPMLLLMFPLSAFVASKWTRITADKRRLLIGWSTAFGLLYGGMSAAALTIGGEVFLERVYHIAPVGSRLEVAAISILFMGMMAAKAYGLIVYAIDHGRFLSVATLVSVLTAALAGGLSAIWNTPLRSVSIFGFVGGICLMAAMIGDALKRRRSWRVLA